MTNILNNPVLVLNKSWIPIRIETVRSAIERLFSARAVAIDEEFYQTYTWEEWLLSYSLSREVEWTFPYKFINAVHINIRLPEVVLLVKYNKIPQVPVRLTRKNLLIRDSYMCQYSGKKLKTNEATVDHVIPKSRGGKTVWNNVVISTKEINSKKGNKTLKEFGMALLKKPKTPIWNPVYTAGSLITRPKSWSKFLKEK